MSITHTITEVEGKISLALEALDLAAHFGGTWGEHPQHEVGAWAEEVANEDTCLGYWEWVANRIDSGDFDLDDDTDDDDTDDDDTDDQAGNVAAAQRDGDAEVLQKLGDTPLAKITFVPQVWVGPKQDTTLSIDPLGPSTWQVPSSRIAGIRPGTLEADCLAHEPEAPEWVREWALAHPFEVEWDEPEDDNGTDDGATEAPLPSEIEAQD